MRRADINQEGHPWSERACPGGEWTMMQRCRTSCLRAVLEHGWGRGVVLYPDCSSVDSGECTNAGQCTDGAGMKCTQFDYSWLKHKITWPSLATQDSLSVKCTSTPHPPTFKIDPPHRFIIQSSTAPTFTIQKSTPSHIHNPIITNQHIHNPKINPPTHSQC